MTKSLRDRRFQLRVSVRRLVVSTSIGPLRTLYLSYYRLVLWWTNRVLSKTPGVWSIYVRRGVAKGHIVPGVSDLDLAVVVEPSEREQVALRYSKISRWAFILEDDLEIYTPESFRQKISKAAHRYRLSEAKATWKLLWGRDFLCEIPNWPITELYPALYREVKIWFQLFMATLVLRADLRDDGVFVNSFCYKFLLELKKLESAWFENRVSFSREETFRELETHDWFPLLSKLKLSHFLEVNLERTLEETWRFAVEWLVDFSEQLWKHPYGCSDQNFLLGKVLCEVLPSEHYEPQPLSLEQRVCFLPKESETIRLLRYQQRPSFRQLVQIARRSKGARTYLALSPTCAISLCNEPESSSRVLIACESPEVFWGPLKTMGPTAVFWDLVRRRKSCSLKGALRTESDLEHLFWSHCRVALLARGANHGELIALHKPNDLKVALTQLGHPPPASAQIEKDGPPFLRRLWASVTLPQA